MLKKLILFSTIAVLGGCETINQTSQCDPEKNYLISNPEAMEKYKKLLKNHQIKSYLIEVNPIEPCDSISCVSFDYNKFDFIEKVFNDSKRIGIYKITTNENKNRDDCLKPNGATKYGNFPCYIISNNKSDVPESIYKYSLKNIDNKQIIISFENIKDDLLLYKYSYQIYSTGAIGGPGFGICKAQKINNPDYKFNAYDFHMGG